MFMNDNQVLIASICQTQGLLLTVTTEGYQTTVAKRAKQRTLYDRLCKCRFLNKRLLSLSHLEYQKTLQRYHRAGRAPLLPRRRTDRISEPHRKIENTW